MSTITLDNYEAFLLDYLEGNLSDSAIAELKAFVINHPELEIDLEDLDLPKIVDEELKFDFKSQLKKTAYDISPETLFDYLENNLPETSRQEIERNLLLNKELANELNLLKKTVLSADLSETFPGRSALHKNEDDQILKDQVLSYFEGQLSESEKAGFEAQLKDNTRLQYELSLYSKTKLEADLRVIFEDKASLKKWVLAYFEGLLTSGEKTAFEAELKKSRELQAELNAYSKTKLVADASVIYPDKEELKKETRVVALFSIRNVAAMAAAILLLVGFFIVFNYYHTGLVITDPEMANKPVQKEGTVTRTDTSSDELLNHPVQQSELAASVKSKVEVKAPNTNSNVIAPNQGVQVKNAPEMIKQEEANVALEPVNKEKPLQQEIIREEEKLLAHEENSKVYSLGDSVKQANSAPEVTEKFTTLLAVAESDEDEAPAQNKKGFWSKAVRLAKRANDMGVKSVDGNETSRQKFSLSFNSFSVEKH